MHPYKIRKAYNYPKIQNYSLKNIFIFKKTVLTVLDSGFFWGGRGGERIGIGGSLLRIEKLRRFIIIFNEVTTIISLESERNCMNKNHCLNFKNNPNPQN